mmetsp:Transcript_21909/g.62855  ORF Transcript_21909/g.62855 Transcript_21909/m.62855 type:complete len:126 (-) Transcript_21909:244-621(-)|eukprot:CAMPEP_0181040212 /NCGR_PEP_ID=MMETSP1070-20121207/10923_1 /TAXON_ID=265543 /ORGANISM="Minutocellus polymorphus, Strain NH13" /LENGTH=125 /DNA_ID=CAMNT_0023118197 /DNA_START=129 /DNA_END=506 /DNA_ORIENTATION=+
MGGHSAWRKRVAAGELAKQSGGAICRHRPHLGRRGKDREVERKGNINGGPRKKKHNKSKVDQLSLSDPKEGEGEGGRTQHPIFPFVTLAFQILVATFLLSLLFRLFTGRSSMWFDKRTPESSSYL